MLSKGTILGHYRILERIGVGGMGEVYVAEDTRIERRVAIKVVRAEPQAHPDSAAAQEASRLFEREMKAITLLDHPNILAMIEFGEQVVGNAPLTYMVMPYRKEGSLNDWLQRLGSHEKLSLDDIDHLITQGADALQHAHNHHIVHQDVKPSNFLIREHPNRPLRPDLLLTDFGVAKLTNSATTASQQVRGTPGFMPPEQWKSKPVPATDQYALAILAYQLMTGSSPFVGGIEQVMYQHLMVPPTPPSAHAPHIPAEVDAVILQALAKNAEERFPSITDFAAALHKAIISREDLQPTLKKSNPPSTVIVPQTSVVTSPSSQAMSSAETTPSASPTYEQNINLQMPVSPLPPVTSPVPVKPQTRKKVSPAMPIIALIALVIVLSASASFVYFARPLFPSPATPTVLRVTPSPTVALVAPNTLTVGVSDSSYISPPEIYYNNGSPAGFDIDLITAIAQAMKLGINIKQYPVDNLIPGLKSKQFDVVIDAYALIDLIRNQTLNVPYLAPKDVLLVPKGNPGHLNFNALTDLCGHTIGVQNHTSELIALNEQKCQQGQINIVKLPQTDDVANALIQKQNNVEAIYQSTLTTSYYMSQFPGKFQQIGTMIQIPREGILIRQDNYNMLAAVQKALNSLEQDGTYRKLLNTSMGDLTGDSIVANPAGTPTQG